MKKIVDEFEIDEFRFAPFDTYFGGLSIASYDIETMGLFARNDAVMLTGIMSVEDGHATATQFFAETLDDEKELLSSTIEELSKYDIILTYNGRSFDVPFTKSRAAKYGIPCELPYDLDLFTILSGYSEIKKFTGSLSQKSIEKYTGISDSREDEIDGYESIRLYNRYLDSPSYDLESKILLHNHDDICQLYMILSSLRSCDLDRAMFHLGYPAGSYITKNVKANSNGLFIDAVKQKDPSDYISFPTEDAPYSLRMSSATGETEVEIPGEILNGDALVIDARTILLSLGRSDDESDGSVSDSDDCDSDTSYTIEDTLLRLEKYPSFQNGYLIIKENGKINYLETNLFIKAFLENLFI